MPKPAPQQKPLNLRGSAKDDILEGGSLGDKINGGKGDDILIGNGGADRLTGGDGADTFRYTALTDSGSSLFDTSLVDQIMDFSSAEGDKIDLSLIDSNPDLAGVQEWLFVGVYRFDVLDKGQLELRANNDGTYTLSIYAAGDSSPDMVILLNSSVTTADFTANVAAAPPLVRFRDGWVNEGGLATIDLTRYGDLTGSTTVTYETRSMGADETDYTHTSGTFTFAPGESTAQIFVQTTDDDEIEWGETFAVRFQVTNGGLLDEDLDGRDFAVVIIEDDDQPTGNDNLIGSTSNDNWINLLGGDDIFDARGGDDIISGGSGDDTITGGDGNDIAIFDGNYGNFTITSTDSAMGETDTVIGVETFRFADGDYTTAVGSFTPDALI